MSENTQPVELLKVVRGNPDDAVLAAISAVVAAAIASAAADVKKQRPREWNAPYRLVRHRYEHGLSGWRHTQMPH